MTTLREAAQMALDLLGIAVENGTSAWSKKANATKDALRAALAQPEQEPVAWMHNFIDEVVIAHRPVDLDRHPDRWTALYKDPTPCQTCEALARTVMMDQTSHDTPPKREWQGLTDEEIENCFEMSMFGTCRAIEAKLREKNFDRPS